MSTYRVPSRIKGFLYLISIMDWATRKVLSWRRSNTMVAGFCVEALKSALIKYSPPEIMNTDQGSQFTGVDWIAPPTDADVRVSIDGRGGFRDNNFIERLWRSLKYRAVYLHGLTDGFPAGRVVDEWMAFYNTDRPHSVLDVMIPDERYGHETQRPLATRSTKPIHLGNAVKLSQKLGPGHSPQPDMTAIDQNTL